MFFPNSQPQPQPPTHIGPTAAILLRGALALRPERGGAVRQHPEWTWDHIPRLRRLRAIVQPVLRLAEDTSIPVGVIMEATA